MALSTVVDLKFIGTLSKALDLAAQNAIPLTLQKQLTMASGVGAGQADKIWADVGTVGPSATVSLDLAGSMLDVFGDAFTPAKLKLFGFLSDPANLNTTHLVRPAAGVPWLGASADLVIIPPGGFLFYGAPIGGITVTATTADIIEITNAAGTNTNTYSVMLVGTSA